MYRNVGADRAITARIHMDMIEQFKNPRDHKNQAVIQKKRKRTKGMEKFTE
ncbi:hypothetical protein KC19_VG281100 [Ceratodon purpureus]|uniref:Uncharacterized protein n=1 Tax=Ceratodon purpureus TaxID=3225 RepID=A0A8T0HUE0_CERPU|nr:hypothetical protein KC19_VG281100 [Ceratodon purpureus]